MKILHLISSGGMYGAEAVITTLCLQLHENGHTSDIACFMNRHRPNTDFYEAARNQGLAVQSLLCRSRIDIDALRVLRRLIVEKDYDVVHSHNYKADVYLRLATFGLPVCVVATCHTWYDNDHAVWLYGVFDRMLLRFFDAVVSVSPGVSLRLKKAGIRSGAVTEITNGIAVEKYSNRFTVLQKELSIPHDRIVVGVVARLSREKGICHFLNAIHLLRDSTESFYFVVVGEGPEGASLRQQTEELGIADKVHFLGRREDMPEVFASIDILVQPSLNEGLPISVLEGMASGCTVIASRVGALPTVIEDGTSGVFVPPGDSQSLSQAILRVGNDPTLQAELGGNAQRRVQSLFSAQEMARKYLSIYEANGTPMSLGRRVPSTL